MLIGDWRLPLLHRLHSGFTSPQNSGPANNINVFFHKISRYFTTTIHIEKITNRPNRANITFLEVSISIKLSVKQLQWTVSVQKKCFVTLILCTNSNSSGRFALHVCGNVYVAESLCLFENIVAIESWKSVRIWHRKLLHQSVKWLVSEKTCIKTRFTCLADRLRENCSHSECWYTATKKRRPETKMRCKHSQTLHDTQSTRGKRLWRLCTVSFCYA